MRVTNLQVKSQDSIETSRVGWELSLFLVSGLSASRREALGGYQSYPEVNT